LRVPSGLEWWRGEPGGAEWFDRLPHLVEELAERWALEVEEPFEPAHISLVVPVVLGDGDRAVLKVNFPERESEHEADALECWSGAGAVRLLARDDSRRALLVERCDPGTQLWEEPDDLAIGIVTGVLEQLWRAPAPVEPFRRLADEASRWADELPARWESAGRPFERGLVDEAVAFIRGAVAEPGDPVVLHQDLHGGNVLRSERGWLAIDPKPLVGEREFDTASLLRDRRKELATDPEPSARVRRRLDLLSERLDLDRERVCGWALAHALAWGYERDRFLNEHVLVAQAIAAVPGG
jgi:streptomycin 6-kinase